MIVKMARMCRAGALVALASRAVVAVTTSTVQVLSRLRQCLLFLVTPVPPRRASHQRARHPEESLDGPVGAAVQSSGVTRSNTSGRDRSGSGPFRTQVSSA